MRLRLDPALALGALTLASVVAAGGAGGLSGGGEAPEPDVPLAPITVDYPADGSIFPPEITPPTFLWRDADERAAAWVIEVEFGDGSPPLRIEAPGERMKVGEIDPLVVAPTNELPTLTPEQAAARAWMPDDTTWATFKARSVERPARVTITGFRTGAPDRRVSRGQITFRTSEDPVGAPIFFRDVPLMPNSSDDGVVTPLPSHALGLVKWRLRHVDERQSRVMMEGLPTCANCHSFSLDGRTMGLDVDGPQNDKGLYALTSLEKHTSIRNEDVIKWSSFRGRIGAKIRAAFMSQVSPKGRYVLTTVLDPDDEETHGQDPLDNKFYGTNFTDYRFLQVFYPTRGILAWYSRETGVLQPLPGADDPRYVQTDGVWSPDGRHVVFARAEARPPYPEGAPPARYANDPNETQIRYDLYRVPFNGGRGGEPVRIVGASENGMSNNFPKVSPDGRWIVYVRCRNGQLMRPDSELYIAPFEGGEARRMRCNTPLMNSWHSFSPNGRWMAFSSKARSPYTQMYLTHIDADGHDSPPILVDNATAANRAVNIPEFVNVPKDGFLTMDAPATDFFLVFNRAAELVQQKRYGAAIPEWERAVALNPEDGKAHLNLALSLHEEGRVEEAIVEYRRAMELETASGAAHANLAMALQETGRLGEATEELRSAVAADPDNAKVQGNFGAALIEMGRTNEGIEHCRRALALDPESPDAHNTLGIALATTGALDEAVSHLEKAVALNPEAFEFQFNLGRVLAAARRFGEAIPPLERAVALSAGEEPLCLDMLAAVYAVRGRLPDAVESARRALDASKQQGNRDLVEAIRAKLAQYEVLAREGQ